MARLFTNGKLERRIARQFTGDYRLRLHLAPPLLARTDPRTGRPKKHSYGPWVLGVMRVQARFKFLRGSPLDPFGYSLERRLERRLIADYTTLIDTLLDELTPANHALAVELASLAQQIRGFGPVKMQALEQVHRRQRELLESCRNANRQEVK